MKDMAGSRTSVHIGCFASDYTSIQYQDKQRIAKYSATGSSSCILANRVSWFFDLSGPSMTIDTACSSSMVAFDLACRGIWNGSAESVSYPDAMILTHPDRVLSAHINAITGNRWRRKPHSISRSEYLAVEYVFPLS
jgi:acyl transferase domain-containing protein